jgi:hypothetical protein
MKTKAQREREARHWQVRKGSRQRHFEAGSLTPEEEKLPKKLTHTEFLEKKVHKSHDPTKRVKEYKRKKVTADGLSDKVEKSGIDSSFTKDGKSIEQDTQLKPTALEVINYKTGTQGYPENVEAFEKMVAEQEPHSHEPTNLLSKREWQAKSDERRLNKTDTDKKRQAGKEGFRNERR